MADEISDDTLFDHGLTSRITYALLDTGELEYGEAMTIDMRITAFAAAAVIVDLVYEDHCRLGRTTDSDSGNDVEDAEEGIDCADHLHGEGRRRQQRKDDRPDAAVAARAVDGHSLEQQRSSTTWSGCRLITNSGKAVAAENIGEGAHPRSSFK